MAERNRRIRVNLQFSVYIQGFAVSQKKRRRVTLPSTPLLRREHGTVSGREDKHETTNAVATFRHARPRPERSFRSVGDPQYAHMPIQYHFCLIYTQDQIPMRSCWSSKKRGVRSVCAFVFHSQWFYLDTHEHRTGDTALCETAVSRSVLRTSSV